MGRPDRAVGTEASDRKIWRGEWTNVHSRGPAKPTQTAAPTKAWRRLRANVGNSNPAAMEISARSKAMKARTANAGRRLRDNVGNSGCVELRKAAAEAATESAAGNAGECGLRARMETGRRMDPA